jgi:protein-tyrosine-phosphatase
MHSKRIWWFAAGFLLFYTPYAALSKAVTSGLVPGVAKGLLGLQILPAAILGTVLTVPLIITLVGWWKYAGVPGREIALSGLGLALIIGSTTVAFTFHGISIVLALILMRGGLLIMAPLIDAMFGRRVRWFSWAALTLSLAGLAVSLVAAKDYSLPLLAALNLAVYLTGYALRTPLMTKLAKVRDQDITRRYFVREVLVTIVLLPLIPAVMAFTGSGPTALALREGFTTFWSMPLATLLPIVMIGVFYASHNIFGTLIYLDGRENTFCVPLFCSASFLAGFSAVSLLSLLAGIAAPPPSQLIAAGIILTALLFLSPLHHQMEEAWAYLRHGGKGLRGATLVEAAGTPAPRLILFVCSGNTCRSPMAAAIAQAEIALRLGTSVDKALSGPHRIPILAESAGLTPRLGAPMTEASLAALARLSVAPRQHEARLVTPQQIAAADAIYCMTAAQRADLLREHPAAAANTYCLDPDGDIPDPIGKEDMVYTETALRIQQLVRMRFDDLGITA